MSTSFVSIMTALIALMGVVTVALSMTVGLIFWRLRRLFEITDPQRRRDRQRLTIALAWQLFGEAVIGVGTLVFAIAAHRGWLPHWSIEAQSMLRVMMFLATGLTTLHLFRVVMDLAEQVANIELTHKS